MRGIGIAKVWIEGPHHSYVSFTSVDSSGEFDVTFQNEKFETQTIRIAPEVIISVLNMGEFMQRQPKRSWLKSIMDYLRGILQ